MSIFEAAHGLELRPYQVEAVRAIAAASRDGRRRPLVVLPTGTGKTVVFCDVIRRATAAGKRALVGQLPNQLAMNGGT
jgi:superfamily II DNA or RNA helicase